MKKLLTVFTVAASILFSGNSSLAASDDSENTVTADKKILIAYYSPSSATEKVAKMIRSKVGGDLMKIEVLMPYRGSYNEITERIKKEMQIGNRPDLKMILHDIYSYDIIFIGAPEMQDGIAPAVLSFLEEYDLSGVTVIPFVTHGIATDNPDILDIFNIECRKCNIKKGWYSFEGNAYGFNDWLKDAGFEVTE